MTEADIMPRLRRTIAETFDVDLDSLADNSCAQDVDGWDSLAHATLVLKLERVFEIAFPPERAASAQTIGDLAAAIGQALAAGTPRDKTNEVFFGSDGRTLFHRDHNALEQITGQLQFTDAELNLWISCIETRHAWCAARGIPYVHLVVPEKHVVYQDVLPPGLAPAADRPVTRLFKSVNGPARACLHYPRALLQQQRCVRDTYISNDTHWSMFGGFLAYQDIMRTARRSLAVTPLMLQDLRFTEQPHVGDLGVRVSPERIDTVMAIDHVTPYPFRILYENRSFERGNVSLYEGPDATQPRAVMFGDSFANYMVPHMIPVFSRLMVVASPHLLYDLLRSEKPDLVVFEMAERFLAFKFGPGGEKMLPGDLAGLDSRRFLGISPENLSMH